MIDENVFKGGATIVMPDVRMKMINELGDPRNRPQAIRDAIRIQEDEKILYQKMKETDPDLLRESSSALDPDRIRQTFYTVVQDNYDKKEYKKLRQINKAIYPRTPQNLNDFKAKRLLEKPEELSLERLLFLQEYLNKINKLRFNPDLAQKKAQENLKNVVLGKKTKRPPRAKKVDPVDEKFARKKARDVMALFPRVRKPPRCMSTNELQEESERRALSGFTKPQLKNHMNVEVYAYKTLKKTFEIDNQLNENIRVPPLVLIDEKSKEVGVRIEKNSGRRSAWNEIEPDTDSHEVIRKIVSKIMDKNMPPTHHEPVVNSTKEIRDLEIRLKETEWLQSVFQSKQI